MQRIGFGWARQRYLSYSIGLPLLVAWVASGFGTTMNAAVVLSLGTIVPLYLRARMIGLGAQGSRLEVVEFLSTSSYGVEDIVRVGFKRAKEMDTRPMPLQVELRNGTKLSVRGVSRTWSLVRLPEDAYSKAERRLDEFFAEAGWQLRCDTAAV